MGLYFYTSLLILTIIIPILAAAMIIIPAGSLKSKEIRSIEAIRQNNAIIEYVSIFFLLCSNASPEDLFKPLRIFLFPVSLTINQYYEVL